MNRTAAGAASSETIGPGARTGSRPNLAVDPRERRSERGRGATGAHTSGGGEEGGVDGEARPAAARVVVVVEAGEGAGEGAPGAGRGGSGGAPGEGGQEAPARDPEHGGWTVG